MNYDVDKLKKRIRNEKKIKRLLTRIIYIIIIPIIIYDLMIMAQLAVNPNATPNIFGIKLFSIVSGSMEPEISKGDVILVEKVDQGELKEGDIISYKVENETITHRIIKIENIENGEVQYTTKGDSNDIPDSIKIKYENIEGKYISKIHKIGKIVILLQNKIVFFIALSILILVYLHERKMIKIKLKRKRKRRMYDIENRKTS